MLNTSRYQYLEPRAGSFYQELFVRGVNLRASRLVAWMDTEHLTPEQAALDRGLPTEAVLEAIDYVRSCQDVIQRDSQRERDLLLERGLVPTDDS